MAVNTKEELGLSISRTCRLMSISQTCYRYRSKLSPDDKRIADWLVRLTTTHRTWGFGLGFLYLRNVKSWMFNHKPIHRIYRQLKLNFRIKPKKRLL